ncbi:neuropeptide S receptor-like [Dendronephthya gigantea]|uniref:neuropeptide S receptor-like n=1 Tax=Dendronephthya gigantea TaxID=151771 RepID=UPI00106BCE7D|nr:neuropeptide S receptor-like [Dendronephthya gigantea]
MTNITKLMMIENNPIEDPAHDVDIPEGITLTVILALSLAGNGLVCYCGLTSTRAQAMNNFIVNLAFAEMFLATLVLPVHIHKQFTGSFRLLNTSLCRILQYFHTATLGVVNLTLTIIALDRYLSIFRPTSKITLRKAKYMIALSWSIPFLVTSPIFLDLAGNSGQMRRLLIRCNDLNSRSSGKFNKLYSVVQIALVSLVPMCLLVGVYSIMVKRILQIDASRKNLKMSQAPGTKKSPCGTFREEVPVAKRRALVMNFIVTCLFLFCWTPVVTSYTVQILRGYEDPRGELLYNLLTYVALANLACNPLVYCFFDSVFRNHLLCCLKQKFSPQHGRNLRTGGNKPLTEDKLGELSVSKINSESNTCSDKEPLLTKNAGQPPSARASLFSKDKLVKLVCNTRRYRSLGLSRSSEI